MVLSTEEYRKLSADQASSYEIEYLQQTAPTYRFEYCDRGGVAVLCETTTPNSRAVLPTDTVDPWPTKVYDRLHAPSHPGNQRILQFIIDNFMWRDMDRTIMEWRRACKMCDDTMPRYMPEVVPPAASCHRANARVARNTVPSAYQATVTTSCDRPAPQGDGSDTRFEEQRNNPSQSMRSTPIVMHHEEQRNNPHQSMRSTPIVMHHECQVCGNNCLHALTVWRRECGCCCNEARRPDANFAASYGAADRSMRLVHCGKEPNNNIPAHPNPSVPRDVQRDNSQRQGFGPRLQRERHFFPTGPPDASKPGASRHPPRC